MGEIGFPAQKKNGEESAVKTHWRIKKLVQRGREKRKERLFLGGDCFPGRGDKLNLGGGERKKSIG